MIPCFRCGRLHNIYAGAGFCSVGCRADGVTPLQELNEMKIEDIARIAHEVNRAYCHALGDHSQPEWHKAPDWQQQSAIHGAEYHVKEAAKGSIPDPAWSHKLWMKEKLATGWRYGPVKDVDLKEHPCMVPFDELPKEQQAKDYIFATVCLQLAALREN